MKRLRPSILLLMAFTLMNGCISTMEQQLYSGDYDTVIRSAMEKMKRTKKRDAYIDLAQKAYNKATAADKARINYLKSNNPQGQNWGKIYYTYRSMIRRQDAVSPYLPIYYTNGSMASIELYDLVPVMEEARFAAAAYHYEQAEQWLAKGTREAGRNAYGHLNDLRQYNFNGSYKNEIQLRSRALEMGTNNVLIRFKSNSRGYLPDDYFSELAYFDYERCVGPWTEIHRHAGDSSIFDFAIEISIEEVYVGPQHVKEVRYQKSKEVEDGTQPLVNEAGEYVVDSSGNVIQVPKYVTLTCFVTEWAQHRDAHVISSFSIYDMAEQRKAVQQPLEDYVVFEHVYAQANGHLDILPTDIRRLIQNRPKPFPSDRDMVFLTSESLKKQIAEAIRRNDNVLASL